MARDPIFPLRVDAERRAVWDAAAAKAGVSTSEFARDAIDAAAALVNEPAPARGRGKAQAKAKTAAAPAPPSSGRSQMCPHRVPPTSYCSRCGV